jgi:hypothetical protein
MRVTMIEGHGIPIENLSDEEVEELSALLQQRAARRKRDDDLARAYAAHERRRDGQIASGQRYNALKDRWISPQAEAAIAYDEIGRLDGQRAGDLEQGVGMIGSQSGLLHSTQKSPPRDECGLRFFNGRLQWRNHLTGKWLEVPAVVIPVP